MLNGFVTSEVDVGETTIYIRRTGTGPPVLLLHGFPETHRMWHRVAPGLAEQFTVVCADLRGYGSSGKPSSTLDHAPYTKAAMARDMVRTMDAQGFARFAVVGHDRGARAAYRMALDHSDRISHLAVLDILPTGEAFGRANARLALAYWPWSLLAQPEPLPERLILADPEAIVDDALRNWGSDASSFPSAVRTAYIDALRNPETLHAICEEYRAAATLDVEDDARDRQANRRIACPTLVLWSQGGPLDTWYNEAGGPLSIWSDWATGVTGRPISGGHFFPEQNSNETTTELRAFLSSAEAARAARR